MKYVINPENRPVYMQIYKQIREDIIVGNYPFNTKLPSKRHLSEETGVSVITVEHAYALLCEEGYVESRERVGYIVIFQTSDGFASVNNPIASEHLPQHQAHDYLDFPISVLSKTMRKVLTEDRDLLFEKSPNPGCMNLRTAIRQYLARNRGIRVDNDQIIIGSGSEYLYSLIVELFGRQHIYAIESPSYKKSI